MVRRRQVLTAGLTLGGSMLVLAGYAAFVHPVGPAVDAPGELRIATGPAGGVYRGMGAALAAELRRSLPEIQVRLVPTDASLDNLALLRRREVDLAFAALDAAADAIADQAAGPESTGAPGSADGSRPGDGSGPTAAARLFDSWMQVLVRADSGIVALRQLDGRPVAAGASGSGTRFGLRRLLSAAGITPVLVTASQADGAAALAVGRVDAFVTFTGVPTPAVASLTAEAAVRVLPLAAETAALTARYGTVYTAATLPSTAYPGLAGAPTLTTPNLLLVRPGLAAPLVTAVTAALYGGRLRIARDHPEAASINVRTGVQTAPVHLHPGAVRYYRDAKP